MGIGLPDFIDDVFPGFIEAVFPEAVENIAKLIAAGARLFSDDAAGRSPLERTNEVLFGPAGCPAPPATPGGMGGLPDGEQNANDQYNGSADATSMTDEKLAEVLRQIFASNQQARERVLAILADIQNKQRQVGPELGDPAALTAFQLFIDQSSPRSKRSSPTPRSTPRRRPRCWMRSARSTEPTRRVNPATAVTTLPPRPPRAPRPTRRWGPTPPRAQTQQ